MSERFQHLRLLEAILFAAAEPLSRGDLARHLPESVDLDGLLEELRGRYADRGVNLVPVGQRWAFRTAPDLSSLMTVEREVVKKLSRAALETLAIIAYHQPVTRAEIEEIRGVALSRGTLDTLLETDWIKPKGRRRTPGRPVTWGTSDAFLDHFGLESLEALPGVKDLKAAGLLDSRVVPAPDLPGESEDTDPEGEGSEDPWEMLAAEFGDEGENDSAAAGEAAAQAAVDTKTPGS